MMKKYIKMVLLYTCIITVMLTGCWNNRDISEMSFATAIGLDLTEDNKIEFTVQIVRPSAIQSNDSQGGGGQSPVWVYSTTGDTVFEALRNSYAITSGRLFISQVQLLAVGEEVARDNILEALDFFERELEINIKVDVAITKGMTAKELLNVGSELIHIPAIHIINTIDNNSKTTAKTKTTTLFDVLVETSRAGQEPLITAIEKSDSKNHEEIFTIRDLKVEGTAVFNGPKLVGWLNSEETRGFMFIDNEVESTIISIPNPVDKNKFMAIEVLEASSKKDVQIKNGNIIFFIEVEQEGVLGEQRGDGTVITPEMVNKIETETEKIIKEEIQSALRKAKMEYKCDIFGFGEILHRKYNNHWKEIKSNWNEKFSAARVEIKVVSKLKRTGYISQSTQNQ